MRLLYNNQNTKNGTWFDFNICFEFCQGYSKIRLPIIRKRLAETEKGIDNIVNAFRLGIFSNVYLMTY